MRVLTGPTEDPAARPSPGNEFRTEKADAEQAGLTQKQFNDKMNDPAKYQLEDPSSNRSHKFEAGRGGSVVEGRQ